MLASDGIVVEILHRSVDVRGFDNLILITCEIRCRQTKRR